MKAYLTDQMRKEAEDKCKQKTTIQVRENGCTKIDYVMGGQRKQRWKGSVGELFICSLLNDAFQRW
jgi:hypothetical protein